MIPLYILAYILLAPPARGLYIQDPRIKFISASSSLNKIEIAPPPPCDNPGRSQPSGAIEVKIQVLSPASSYHFPDGILATIHRIPAVCVVSFWGQETVTFREDSEVNWNQVPLDQKRKFLQYIGESIGVRLEGYDHVFRALQEESLMSQYSCKWMAETTSFLYYLRMEPTAISWSSEGSLILPLELPSCTKTQLESDCQLSPTTRLFWNPRFLTDFNCSFTLVRNLTGLLHYKRFGEGEFFSHDYRVRIGVTFLRAPDRQPLCGGNLGRDVYLSEEGYYIRVEGKDLNLTFFTTKRNIRGVGGQFNSSHPNHDDRPSSPPSMTFLQSPSKILLAINHLPRLKKSIPVSEEMKRISWLEHHFSWSLSRLSYEVVDGNNNFQELVRQENLRNCETRSSILNVLSKLELHSDYIKLILLRDDVLYLGVEGRTLKFLLGSPSLLLTLPADPDRHWCNGMMRVLIRQHSLNSTQECWLQSISGVCYSADLIPQCSNSLPPRDFLVPQYDGILISIVKNKSVPIRKTKQPFYWGFPSFSFTPPNGLPFREDSANIVERAPTYAELGPQTSVWPSFSLAPLMEAVTSWVSSVLWGLGCAILGWVLIPLCIILGKWTWKKAASSPPELSP